MRTLKHLIPAKCVLIITYSLVMQKCHQCHRRQLQVYSIYGATILHMALLAMPHGHMARWFQVTLHRLIIGPSQLTQLCLHFLGAPPYVSYQAINRLKHGFPPAILAIMAPWCLPPEGRTRTHATYNLYIFPGICWLTMLKAVKYTLIIVMW